MIREMTLSDALYVIARMRESDRRALSAVCPGMTDEAFAIDRFGTDYRYTLTADDGEPVAIGGARVAATGCATIWIVATDRMPEVAKPLLRFGKRFVSGLMGELGLRRLEGYWLEGEERCERFAKGFGFLIEGCRRKAGAGGENIIFAGKVV